MKVSDLIRGSVGLLASTKGVLSVSMLVCMTWLCHGGHIDGAAYAAACGVISTIFCWTRHRTDVASLEQNNLSNFSKGQQ